MGASLMPVPAKALKPARWLAKAASPLLVAQKTSVPPLMSLWPKTRFVAALRNANVPQVSSMDGCVDAPDPVFVVDPVRWLRRMVTGTADCFQRKTSDAPFPSSDSVEVTRFVAWLS